MRAASVLCVAAVLAPGLCAGQCRMDGAGVFFDQLAEEYCLTTGLDSLMSAYLILCEPSAPEGVGGWQARLTGGGGVTIFNVVPAGEAINIGSGGDFIVGIGQPLPWSETVILASLQVYATEAGGIFIGPLSGGGPVKYCAGDASATLKSMWLIYGGGEAPCASICMPSCPEANAPPPVSMGEWIISGPIGSVPLAGSNATWGGVKGLYRKAAVDE